MDTDTTFIYAALGTVIAIPIISAVMLLCLRVAFKFGATYLNCLIVTLIISLISICDHVILFLTLGPQNLIWQAYGIAINIAMSVYIYAKMIKNTKNEQLGYAKAGIITVLFATLLSIITMVFSVFTVLLLTGTLIY